MKELRSDGLAWRFKTMEIILGTVALLIVGQTLRIQASDLADLFRKQGNNSIGEWRTTYPGRGNIYDRWGHALAANETVYEVGAELRDVKNPETIALTLMGIVKTDYNEVLTAASKPYSLDPEHPSVYAVLADFVTQDQKDKIQQIAADLAKQPKPNKKGIKAPSLAGLVFVPHPMRSYPEKELASNIIGFVNRKGVPAFGVEQKFNEMLAGAPQRIWVPLDPNRAEDMPEIPNGASLILTIDRDIQVSMEGILDKALETSGSDGGVIAVMDPKTGEILAMASTPRLDINKFWDYTKVFPGSLPFNRAISQAYEPGSVFKVLTMAAALDSGVVKPDTEFIDTGTFQIGGTYIHNWNGGAWGPQTMLGCMQHSLNVCLAWVATQLGSNRFYNYMENFGVGHLTGIELAGEVSGRLKLPGDDDWYEADLGTNSFGQGVAVTPVQMLMAVSAVANGGKMMAPHIIHSMVNNGHQYDTTPQVVGMPISAKTAKRLNDLLATSLETEGSDALVDGYRVAGKTGTAEIPISTGYSETQTNASFVGWGPVDDPRFIVYVWLEKPTTSPWGSVVAAPVFKEAVERLVILMNLPPDSVRQKYQTTSSQ